MERRLELAEAADSFRLISGPDEGHEAFLAAPAQEVRLRDLRPDETERAVSMFR